MATTVTLKPNAIDLSGSTSGTTTLQATAVAGTTTVTLPAATDTLVGKATTDTLTNKTLTAPTLASANITTALTLTGASGTNGQYLTSAGSGNAPTWTTVASSQWTTSGANIYYNSGNVGIGTASPTAKLDVSTSINLSVNYQNVAFDIGGGTGWLSGYNVTYSGGVKNILTGALSSTSYQGGSAIWYTNGSSSAGTTAPERMRLNSDGFLLYNTTSTTVATASTANTGGINFRNDATSGNGVIDIARTSDFPLNLNRLSTTGGLVNFLYNGSAKGTISTDGTNVAYNTSSDYRLKENIAPMTGALAKVAQLKPVTFKWIQNGSNSEGFIAHELAEVCPHAVSGEKDATREEEYEATPAVIDKQGNITTPAVMDTRTVPVYQGIDVSFLVATLTAAIQELSAKNDALTARIVALEAK
jgi:hypothetical protein